MGLALVVLHCSLATQTVAAQHDQEHQQQEHGADDRERQRKLDLISCLRRCRRSDLTRGTRWQIVEANLIVDRVLAAIWCRCMDASERVSEVESEFQRVRRL